MSTPKVGVPKDSDFTAASAGELGHDHDRFKALSSFNRRPDRLEGHLPTSADTESKPMLAPPTKLTPHAWLTVLGGFFCLFNGFG